jgi:hypothetical protein
MGRPAKHQVVDGCKQCSKCGTTKPHTSEFFIVGSTKRGSKLGAACKACVSLVASPRMLKRYYALSDAEKSAQTKKQRAFLKTPAGKLYNRASQLRSKFGVTLEWYEGQLHKQGYACALCGAANPTGRGAFHVDHDHTTGTIRGLLCHGCNTGIGSFGENTNNLLSAIRYLSSLPPTLELAVTPLVSKSAMRRDRYLRTKFGISLGTFQRLLESQNNSCAICASSETGWDRPFHVDHHHGTGVIRGLLCNTCNLGLGSLRDDSALLRIAISYLCRGLREAA